MDFRILGRLEVRDADRDATPTRAKTRALLALFLLHPNERLTTERIIEDLWGEAPPATADKALQGHVSALRKLLGPARIRTEPGGYRLTIDPDELDAGRFAAAVSTARSALAPADRARLLDLSLDMWRGDVLADLADEPFVRAAVARLEDLRLLAQEERIAAALAMGRHGEVLPSLERLVAEHPLREGLRANLMRALYRAGRQSDALRTYREGRRHMAEELGIEPGAELQLLERQVLGHDPSLDLGIPSPSPAIPARQERKTVTVLVVEVVAASETDPEDLDGLAQPALGRVRAAVEEAGGRAEPLFANAVLGLFGAPRVHDDDPLRAVGVAMELLAASSNTDLRIRGGIETGEALVTIDGDSVAVTGQVLGAASNLQAAAALGTILVGPATHRATQDVIDYDEVGGPGWAPRGRRTAAPPARPEAPFVGRADELRQLEVIFGRARDGRTAQLVTITAEPGGGKSRLLRELRARLERDSESGTPRWLQGRCLPYGNGMTFWAVGAAVRDWAGILETDDAAASMEKLDTALAAVEPDEVRRTWLARSAGPLVGIDDAASPGDPAQASAAWRQLLESIALQQPLVLAVEDLHWADDALIGFLDHLVDQAAGVPLLVICTARPELLDARPNWGAGKRNAATILLGPLSDADAGRLLEVLLGRMPDADMVRRAGGNPLYAHELARFVTNPAVEPGPIPESLQAVIAAHLDALPADLKVVAANAAVVGEVFWPGVVAEIGGVDQAAVAAGLHRLAANEVIRRRLRSTVAGQEEYEFLHVLVRDVAYGQIPRRDRVAKHRAAAAWIERLAEDRPTAHAELAAHHYVEALALARRLDDADQVSELYASAVAALSLAGDGARSVDVVRASGLYRQALELLAPDGPGRGGLLARLGEVAQLAGDLEGAERLTRTAVDDLLAAGDTAAAATAMVSLESVSWRLGRPEADRKALLREAVRLLEDLPPSPELVQAYAQSAAHELYAGSSAGCVAWSSRALAVADTLGAPALQVQARQYLGIARFEQGEVKGIDDVRSAISLGLEAGLTWQTAHAQADLGAMVWLQEGPAHAIPLKATAAEFAESRGMTALAETTRAQTLWMLYDAGAWDELLPAAQRLVTEEALDRGRVTMIAHSTTARVLAARGRVAEALPLAMDVLERGRGIGDAQDLDPSLATAALVRSAAGDGEAALALVAEMEEGSRGLDLSRRAHDVAPAVRISVRHGQLDLARRFLDGGSRPGPTRAKLGLATATAIIAEADADLVGAADGYSAAARGWAAYGCPEEEAHALLGRGRCLVATGQPARAATPLRRAERIGRALGTVTLSGEAARLLVANAARLCRRSR